MKHQKSLVAFVLCVAVLAGMGWWMLQSEADVLYRAQELSLFLPTRLFYQTSTIYPGGTLTWLAAFFTQFFFHPTTGVTLLVAAWSLIVLQLSHAFRLRGAGVLIALTVPLALMACVVQTGYWIYYMKLQGHLWVPTLGVIFALLATQIHRVLPSWWRFGWFCVFGLVGYPLMGAWSFLGLLLMVCQYWFLGKDKRAIASVFALIAFIWVVPKVWCNFLFHQTEPGCMLYAAMPSFAASKEVDEACKNAYYVLAASFLPAVLVGTLPKIREWLLGAIAVVLVGASLWWVNVRWYRDTNFYKETAMNNCIERLDWEGVLRVMRSHDYGEPMPPTRVMVMEKNLALFRLGRAGDEMFHYPEGAEQQHAAWNVRMTQVGGKMLYYHYGKEQFCYRWCMEDGVEYGWSVDVLKYMTKASLITHDWQVARKYLNLLKKTRYHREWAEHYEQFVEHPEQMEQDEEMSIIIPMARFPDRLDGDMTLVELYLLKAFANGIGADKYYQENTLICSMIMKDIDLFWPRFHRYIQMHRDDEVFRVPIHYQEAAYLYSMLEPQRESEMWPGMTNAEALQRIPFDEGVKQKYADFMKFNQQCGSMSEEQKKVAFAPQFGDTFFYFYFLVRNQKTN